MLDQVLNGRSDANVRFSDLCGLLRKLNFEERVRGSHHIFTLERIEEIINLQPKGARPKAYQVRQVRGDNPEVPTWRRFMSKYEVIIYWSEEDNSLVAEIPELAGCMADGATYQEALANAEVVIQEWIETAAELGRPIPQPKGRLIYA